MNKKLVTLVEDWKSIGSPKQEGFDWTSGRKNWENTFPMNAGFITTLPSEIDRDAVRELCFSSSLSIREKFLTVMIWGYGDRGYGPYRVTQMLKQPNSEDVLTQVYELCHAGNPKAAYEYLRKNRIRILGPSYSSKVLTFFTPREIGAPIYDSYIALWIEKFAKKEFEGVSTSSELWSSKTYSKYWDWIKEHSGELGCFPDEIELVLFRDAEIQFSKASNWRGK